MESMCILTGYSPLTQNLMSKTPKIIGILIVLTILLRGILYRLTVEYEKIGDRPAIEIEDDKLIQVIDSISGDRKIDLNQIVEISSLITRKNLRFTFEKADKDPNQLIYTKKSNCVGYSAMFNSIADYLIEQNDLEDEYESSHLVGRLRFMGIDIHRLFDDPFFKDHDFNEILNLDTGERISIDPTVNDYSRIRRVSRRRSDN